MNLNFDTLKRWITVYQWQSKMVNIFSMFLLFLPLFTSASLSTYTSRIVIVAKRRESDWNYAEAPTQAEVSQKTWNEYLAYKERTCRSDKADDPAIVVSDYLKWEELTFYKNLRLRLLPNSASGEPPPISETLALAKLDNRFLAAEPESLCKMGALHDTDSNQIPEKDRFEDELISGLFRNELRSQESKSAKE